jgi:hypothetical protein
MVEEAMSSQSKLQEQGTRTTRKAVTSTQSVRDRRAIVATHEDGAGVLDRPEPPVHLSSVHHLVDWASSRDIPSPAVTLIVPPVM